MRREGGPLSGEDVCDAKDKPREFYKVEVPRFVVSTAPKSNREGALLPLTRASPRALRAGNARTRLGADDPPPSLPGFPPGAAPSLAPPPLSLLGAGQR